MNLDWERWRFVFVFLFSASDFIAAGLIGGCLWWRRNGGTPLLGLAFIGLSIRGFGELVAGCFGWQQTPVPTPENAVCYWSTRVASAMLLWILVHYILWTKGKGQSTREIAEELRKRVDSMYDELHGKQSDSEIKGR